MRAGCTGRSKAGAAGSSAVAPRDLELAAEFARRLRKAAGGVAFEVTLFGSRARGDNERDSDLDLFVAVDVDHLPPAFLESARAVAADLTLEAGILVSAFLADREYMRTHQGWSLLETIAEEGVPV